jgi:hypothetical protein
MKITTTPSFTYIITTQTLSSGYEGQPAGEPSMLKIESPRRLSEDDIVRCMKPLGYDREVDSLNFKELRDIGTIVFEG